MRTGIYCSHNGSVEEHLSSIHEAIGSIPVLPKTKTQNIKNNKYQASIYKTSKSCKSKSTGCCRIECVCGFNSFLSRDLHSYTERCCREMLLVHRSHCKGLGNQAEETIAKKLPGPLLKASKHQQ